MRSSRAFSSRAGIFVLACLLVGCSAVRLGYSNGETVVYWWLNSYVDFESDQTPWVKRHISHLFDWHRKTQLDDYAKLLTQTQQQLQRKVTPADVAADYDALKKRMLIVIDKAIPELTDLALSLQPQQIAQIEKKFESNNEKYRKEYLQGDLEQRQHVRYKKVMKQAEYWFGNFSAEQEARIRAASDARPANFEAHMAGRMRRQQEMVALLRKIQVEKPKHETAMRMLRTYVTATMVHFGDEKQKAVADAYADSTVQLSVMIINMATPQQTANAMTRLQKWIDDCRSMAGKEG
ncbi:DUF6279 family lipoprotein [Noviherbaspirillum cavernae]|nr:DUF6279 family lipoprotein [Noviherbaspirillum cavernae]